MGFYEFVPGFIVAASGRQIVGTVMYRRKGDKIIVEKLCNTTHGVVQRVGTTFLDILECRAPIELDSMPSAIDFYKKRKLENVSGRRFVSTSSTLANAKLNMKELEVKC